jgi:hypothetical protein
VRIGGSLLKISTRVGLAVLSALAAMGHIGPMRTISFANAKARLSELIDASSTLTS